MSYSDAWGPERIPVLQATLPEDDFPLGILPTAIGFYARPDPGFLADPLSALGGWTGPAPARWTVNPFSRHIAFPTLGGYSLFAAMAIGTGPDRWARALEGLADDPNIWAWTGQYREDFLFVWRGESEDGSIDFDCWQNPDGGSECLTSAPEPSTVLLVLTGLLALGAAARARGLRISRRGAR